MSTFENCDETCTADCGHCKGRRFGPYIGDLAWREDHGRDDDLHGGMVVAAWAVITVGLAIVAAIVGLVWWLS